MKKILKQGFTIIELIVVIAIIAVLAGIVLVSVQQYIQKSKESAIKADMAQLPVLWAQCLEANQPADFQNFLSNPNYGGKVYSKIIEILGENSNPSIGGWDLTGGTGLGNYSSCTGQDGNGYWLVRYTDNTKDTEQQEYCIDSSGAIITGSDVGNGRTCLCQK